MNHKLFGMVMTTTMILAGCGTNIEQANVPDAAFDNVDYTIQGGYALAAVDDGVTIQGCEASSTRSSYFQAGYAIDGNLHSAWAPAATDVNPSLVLSLGAVRRLSRVSLKQSHTNVTVDVAVSKAGGAWTTVASGLAPVPTTLSDMDLAACEGDRVKLTFHGEGLADLQVCEVQLGAAAAVPAPTPSTTPNPVPTPAPTPTPDCNVTGGGWLPAPHHDQDHDVCFAFDVDLHAGACDGTIDVSDLTTSTRFHGQVTDAACRGNLVTFKGRLDDGQAFTCTVVDEGKHGRTDTISFQTSDGTLLCGCLEADDQLGGKIRIRQRAAWDDLVAIGVQVRHEDERHVRFDLKDYEKRCREAAKHKPRKGKGHGDN
jgi:hypothetical protein